MIHMMGVTKKTDVNADIEFIEKLYRLGDDTSVQHLARGLLLSETLTPRQKKRIRRVLHGSSRSGTAVTALIVLAVIVIFYLYIRYGA